MSEPEVPVHPECEKMHAHGYCACTMVECISCDRAHPPHHPCGPPARDLIPLKEKK